MNIVLVGIYYPVAILRYFEAALGRRSDVTLFTAGPYTGRWIPWQGGMNLLERYAQQPDLILGMNPNATVPSAFVATKLPWEPDLWLQVDAGYHLTGKPKSGLSFIVGTDPHVLDYDAARKCADVFFGMQTPYLHPEDVWLPYAYDPIWHGYVGEPAGHYQWDACLIGMFYPNRTRIVDALRGKGFKIYYETGPAYNEARAYYAQAPIALNWSSLQDTVARVFETMAMGRCVVTNRTPDLAKVGFVEGRDYLGFDTLEEAVQMVDYALTGDAYKSIAESGRKAVAEHTWDARIETILQHYQTARRPTDGDNA